MVGKFKKLFASDAPLQLFSIWCRRKNVSIKVYFQTLFARLYLFRWGVITGPGLSVSGKVQCINEGSLRIGSNVRINSGPDRNFVGGNMRTLLKVAPRGKLEVGNGVGMSGVTIVTQNHITIGNHTLLGGGCEIYDNDFHELDPKERLEKSGNIKSYSVTIGNNVFIGAQSIILKGVTIGNCSIVGAGSVVAQNIPAYEVWAGNPACRIKSIASS